VNRDLFFNVNSKRYTHSTKNNEREKLCLYSPTLISKLRNKRMTTNQSEYKIEFPKFDFADSLNANSEDYLMSSYKIALNNNVEQSVPVHEMPDGELEFDKADETFSSKHVLQVSMAWHS
jgi:hypothetical protein